MGDLRRVDHEFRSNWDQLAAPRSRWLRDFRGAALRAQNLSVMRTPIVRGALMGTVT